MSRPPFDVAHFQYRLVVDAMNEATAGYWLRRARAFGDVLPRPNDYPGRATPDQHDKRARLTSARMLACSRRAELCTLNETEERLILDTIADSHTRAARLARRDVEAAAA